VGLVQLGERGGRVPGKHQLQKPPDAPAIGDAQHVAHLLGADGAVTVRDGLVEDRQTVARRALGRLGDHPQRFVLGVDAFGA